MNTWINYHHLYYFKTIAEEGSVSRAAEKLRLGQPTLSAQLKQFEDTLGVRLFERQKKRLVITEHGKIALDYSKTIFRMGSEMYEALHDRLRPTLPHLHLGAIDSVSKQVVVQVVQKAFEIQPCQITLSEGKYGDLLRELTAHKMDMLISNFLSAGHDGKGLYAKSITKRSVALYGAAQFKPLKSKFPSSISGVPMILPTYDSKLRQDIDHWAKTNSLDLNIVVESQDISVKKLMAVNGMGLIAAASHTVMSQTKRKELFEIGNLAGVQEELFLITSQRKIENPIAAQLSKDFKL